VVNHFILEGEPMKKYLVLAAVLVIAACGKKDEAAPAVDTTTAAPAPAMTDSAMTDSAMPMDSTMTRDSAHSM
jgi:hypothetical protein